MDVCLCKNKVEIKAQRRSEALTHTLSTERDAEPQSPGNKTKLAEGGKTRNL